MHSGSRHIAPVQACRMTHNRVITFIYNIHYLEQPIGMFDTHYGRLRLAHDFGYGQQQDFFRLSVIGARL
jgi:hypothetical protein